MAEPKEELPMKHATSWILVGLLVVVAALPAFASDETTVTGCLAAGEEEGTWVLTTDDGEVHVTGPAEIGDHEGHKVELSGHWEGDEEEKHFEAASVKHISTECETEG